MVNLHVHFLIVQSYRKRKKEKENQRAENNASLHHH